MIQLFSSHVCSSLFFLFCLLSCQLVCFLPSWLEPQPTLSGLPIAPDSPLMRTGVHCAQIGLTAGGLTSVFIDATYSNLTLCTCDANYFGRDGICIACPNECTCRDD